MNALLTEGMMAGQVLRGALLTELIQAHRARLRVGKETLLLNGSET